jgi:hypothetical protein
MHPASILKLAALSLTALAFGYAGTAAAADPGRISGPVVHENLAIYFIHGAVSNDPVPLTLEEAMAKGVVRVYETGSVNELAIENLGADEVFVQSGDIVKGGRQDRVLSVSLVLPSKSGRVPIASFCVEHGRWTARGKEDAQHFASASRSLPSREAKIAMRAPPAPRPSPSLPIGQSAAAVVDTTGSRQQEVWRNVAKIQDKLSVNVGAKVASPTSASSLQLSLENEKLKDALATYVKALEPAGLEGSDIVGYAFAINGKLNSADAYPSNGLFRKMWHKLLSATATEAIGERSPTAAPPPSVESVMAFLAAAEQGAANERSLTERVRLETRDADKAVYFEARRGDGSWFHRNYLAK